MLIVCHLGTPNLSFPVAPICFNHWTCDLGLFISVSRIEYLKSILMVIGKKIVEGRGGGGNCNKVAGKVDNGSHCVHIKIDTTAPTY